MIPSDSNAIFCVALAVLLAGPASADATMDALRQCRVSTVDAVRLACYDRVSDPDKQQAETAEAADPAAEDAAWTVTTEKSAMTDDTNHYVDSASSEYQACGQYGDNAQLHVMARCLEDTTALIVYGNCHFASGFDGYGQVTWRLDEDKPVTKEMQASTDNRALGLWSGKQAIPALKSFFGKERMVVRITPFGMSPIEATFDIRGLEEAVQPLREECGW
jgi:type VI secretion system protein VasI